MTQKTEVFEALKEHGPMNIAQLREKVPKINTKSVEARVWDLRQEGYIAMGEDNTYQVITDNVPPEGRNQPTNGHSPVASWEGTETLTGDQDKFKALLKECGVNKAIDPITEMFFSGDPEDLANLVTVLEDARAFVNAGAKRMLVRYWATYIQRAVPDTLEERLSQDGRGGDSKKTPGSEFMEDLGWKVEKDRDGEWIPRPSGDLTYSHALKWAATMNASRPVMEKDEDPEDREDTPTRGRKRGGRQEDSVLAKLLDRAFPERDDRDETIKALERRLDEQDRSRQDDRMERLEAMVGAVLNRNPMADYIEMQTQLQTLGLGGGPQQHVTDTSPTVQLVKDQSDKVDKNMNRALGILERVVLKDHNTLTPEETSSSPKEQEEKAAELLGKIRQGTRSKALRTKLWPG